MQEYLLSERIRTGPVSHYAISKGSANMAITETCLAYILHLRKPPSLIHQTVKEYPLARYAAESWSQHAEVAGPRSVIIKALSRELFTADSFPYLNWAILYDHNSGSTTDSPGPPVSPLYYAVETGCVDVAREMLERNIDVNLDGGNYGSVLNLAIRLRDKPLIQLLVSHGASKYGSSHGNLTVLEEALRQGDPGTIKMLLRSFCEAYFEALAEAHRLERTTTVHLLLDNTKCQGVGQAYGENYTVRKCNQIDKRLSKGGPT